MPEKNQKPPPRRVVVRVAQKQFHPAYSALVSQPDGAADHRRPGQDRGRAPCAGAIARLEPAVRRQPEARDLTETAAQHEQAQRDQRGPDAEAGYPRKQVAHRHRTGCPEDAASDEDDPATGAAGFNATRECIRRLWQ